MIEDHFIGSVAMFYLLSVFRWCWVVPSISIVASSSSLLPSIVARRNLFTVTSLIVALFINRSTALSQCSQEFRNLVVGAAGCLCEVNGSTVCITQFGGAGLYYRNSNDVIFGPWSGACIANESGYFNFPQSPFMSVCPKVLGFCDSATSTEVCCKDAGCVACRPYESGCMGFVPQYYSDNEWTVLKMFFDEAGYYFVCEDFCCCCSCSDYIITRIILKRVIIRLQFIIYRMQIVVL